MVGLRVVLPLSFAIYSPFSSCDDESVSSTAVYLSTLFTLLSFGHLEWSLCCTIDIRMLGLIEITVCCVSRVMCKLAILSR